MGFRSHALGGFQGLAKDPFRWFAAHLAVYGAVAVTAAILFVLVTAIYAGATRDEVAGTPKGPTSPAFQQQHTGQERSERQLPNRLQ